MNNYKCPSVLSDICKCDISNSTYYEQMHIYCSKHLKNIKKEKINTQDELINQVLKENALKESISVMFQKQIENLIVFFDKNITKLSVMFQKQIENLIVSNDKNITKLKNEIHFLKTEIIELRSFNTTYKINKIN